MDLLRPERSPDGRGAVRELRGGGLLSTVSRQREATLALWVLRRLAIRLLPLLLCVAGWSTVAGSASPLAEVEADIAPFGFVRIAPGAFLMGSPEDEPGRFSDETQHPVTLTRPFYLCDHLVTQLEWSSVMNWNESLFQGDPDRPVENITWFDSVEFCNALSLAQGLVPAYEITHRMSIANHLLSAYVVWDLRANGYRLPTDAEWEYAGRAGGTTAFYNGPILVHDIGTRCVEDVGLNEISWYCATSGGQTHPVRTKPPNAWGLYDMAGNVQEWCWDLYADLTEEAAVDPTGPKDGIMRIWRGGGWNYDPRHCRSAQRGRDEPAGYYSNLGVRICRNAS